MPEDSPRYGTGRGLGFPSLYEVERVDAPGQRGSRGSRCIPWRRIYNTTQTVRHAGGRKGVMAGHSHWNNIQHKKGVADAKRGRPDAMLAGT